VLVLGNPENIGIPWICKWQAEMQVQSTTEFIKHQHVGAQVLRLEQVISRDQNPAFRTKNEV
jgi:hypothetical protein